MQLSPSHLHNTHNYAISISASTALCINQNYNKILERDWLLPARFEQQ